jgi:methylenetetrahydrofolate reductase (NADPH)
VEVVRMKIRDIIAGQDRGISFEFFPPKSEEGDIVLLSTLERLKKFKPAFVSVTYRPGTRVSEGTGRVVERILGHTEFNPMPHVTCIGESPQDLRATLEYYEELGIDNILALRGDPPKEGTYLTTRDGNCHAIDMVGLAASFGAFSIGVAAYPEGHKESPGLESDLVHTKLKIEAGADFAITQMFLDNNAFYRFLERAQRIGIDVPIIPGIMPVSDIQQIKTFSAKCDAILPTDLVDSMEKAASPAEARQIGIDFTTKQCIDLLNNGIRYIHFYTLNRAEMVSEILCNLDLCTRPQEVNSHEVPSEV